MTINWPSLEVAIAFGYDPGDPAKVYTVIPIDLVDQMRTERGQRSLDIGGADPGKCVLRLLNKDRRFDPHYTGSPYYPNVKPGVSVRVQMTYAGTTYSLFTGTVEGWPQTWDGPQNWVTITALDALDTLNNANVTPGLSIPQQQSGDTIADVLDAIGWPAAARDLDTGVTPIQARVFGAGEKAYTYLKRVADTEQGYMFARGDGWIVFLERHAQARTPYTVVQVALSNAPGVGELPYASMQDPAYSYRDIKNDVQVTPEGMTTKRGFNQASIDDYGPHAASYSTLHADVNEAQDMANHIVNRFKDPQLFMRGIVLDPIGDPALWPHVLGRELGDRISGEVQPPGPVGLITQEAFIQTIVHEYRYKDWKTTWDTVPVFSLGSPWFLGTVGSSELGINTYLGY